MSTFTLAISCLTTSNLPWFMDLTFQIPMQYCFLQHWTLLLSPVTSTAGYCFYFGSIPSFFLELFLHWSLVACWAPTDLGVPLSVSYHFCLFILFMGFSREENWSCLPFPSPMDLILSESDRISMKMLIKLKNTDYPEGEKEQNGLGSSKGHFNWICNIIVFKTISLLINLDNRTVLHVLKFSWYIIKKKS